MKTATEIRSGRYKERCLAAILSCCTDVRGYRISLENKAGAEQPQRANAAYAISEDEISLRDLWEIIAKRKWLVFLSTVVCLGLAAAYVSLETTIYESRAMVQIGKVTGQPVDNGLQLASRLMNQYTLVNTGQAKKQMPKLYAVTPDKADGSILTLEAQGHSPQEAQQYLQGVIQRLLAEDQQRYQQIVGARQAQLAQYQRMRATLDTKSGKGRVGSTSALLVLERFRRTDALTSIQASIAGMENALTPNNTSPTVQTLSPRYDPYSDRAQTRAASGAGRSGRSDAGRVSGTPAKRVPQTADVTTLRMPGLYALTPSTRLPTLPASSPLEQTHARRRHPIPIAQAPHGAPREHPARAGRRHGRQPGQSQLLSQGSCG